MPKQKTPAVATAPKTKRTKKTAEPKTKPKGMRFERSFADPTVHPFDQVEWVEHDVLVSGADGKPVFEQQGVSAPSGWSEQSVQIVAKMYLWGQQDTPERETSIRQLVYRVAHTIALWGWDGNYFDSIDDAVNFELDLTWLLLNQHGAFNSPVWFNLGLHDQYGAVGTANGYRWDEAKQESVRCEDALKNPQISACFIQDVSDDMESIMDLAKSEAMLFKYGSGTGTDLTTLRSTKEKLTGGGTPSGPVSFMRIYDAIAGTVKSGGRSRRAAKINTLRCYHPDIMEFIQCKEKEEIKARDLIGLGYSSHMDGEAYRTVFYQNANLSVRCTDEFMDMALGGGDQLYPLKATTTGETIEWVDPSMVLDEIARCAWECGDPGVQFEDTIQGWNTSSNTDLIRCTNPCAEFVYIDNTSCNLASLNLMKFRNASGAFDAERFRRAVRIFITAQEILVTQSSYPTAKIAERTYKFRPLGLGYTNLGCFLMSKGLPYGGDEGRNMAAAVTALMHAEANRTSAEIASFKGAFEGHELNREPMARVIQRHLSAIETLIDKAGDESADIAIAAHDVMYQAIKLGRIVGYRNGQVTVLAPCGTISFFMGADTTGLEPALALVVNKALAGGGKIRMVNGTVPEALKALGYQPSEVNELVGYVEEHGTLEGSFLQPSDLPVFDCAFPANPGGRALHWRDHMGMVAAIQPMLSGSASKTVNFPADSTPADIREAYIEAWRLGLKCIAVYRDGCKGGQPISAAGSKTPVASSPAPVVLDNTITMTPIPPAPIRRRLPDTRQSVTHKFSVGGVEGYATVGLFSDGTPGELFVQVAKEGSTFGGLVDAWATAVSLLLQYGCPVEAIANKFAGSRFDPAGMTRNQEIPIASSYIDYIARWLGSAFSSPVGSISFSAGSMIRDCAVTNCTVSLPSTQPSPAPLSITGPQPPSAHAPICQNCGSLTVPTGRCHACPNCGLSLGCG